MYRSILFIFFIGVEFSSISSVTAQSMPGKSIYLGSNATGRIDELPYETPETKGTTYLSDKWYVGTIYLPNEKVIENYPLKYEIAKRQLEIKAGDRVKVLQAEGVLRFEWFDTDKGTLVQFINPGSFTFQGTQTVGFFEVIVDGNWRLLSRTEVDKVKGNYVAALDMGDASTSLVKKEKLYIAHGNHVSEIAKDKKEFAVQFGMLSEQVYKFIKQHKLSIKHKEDLAKIILYVNSLG